MLKVICNIKNIYIKCISFSSMDSLRSYNNEDIILELPGDKTIFNIDWLSVFDMKTKSNYGSVIIPDGLNVPPSLIKILKRTQSLPNCVQLHKRYQVAWEIFGPQITIQLVGQVGKLIHSQLFFKNRSLNELLTHFHMIFSSRRRIYGLWFIRF